MPSFKLTAEGAARLRRARDFILANPSEFRMDTFHCSTGCCIGGHILRQLISEGLIAAPGHSCHVSIALGFGPNPVSYRSMGQVDGVGGHPLFTLFYRDLENNDPVHHAARINTFLWDYGFPADEVTAPAEILTTI